MQIPRSTLSDYERGHTEPNIELLVKMAAHFEVTVDGLVNSDLSHQDYEIMRNKDLRILAITVDNDNNGNIELVDRKAEAGYLEGFYNPEYLSELPKIHFPNIPQGTYRGFEVNGNSMLPIEPGTVLICSYIESLDHIKDDKTYVVVSKQEGIVYKRLTNDNKSKKLILTSDNTEYPPYEIAYTEVAEVWEHYAHLCFSDEQLASKDNVDTKLEDIQRTILALQKNMKE